MLNNDSSNELHIEIEQISSELRIRPEIYIKIVINYANSLTGKMNALSDALTSNNIDQTRMILHEIKGTAGNLRLHAISAAEEIMHVAVKSGDRPERLFQHLDRLKQEVIRLQQFTQKIRQ